MAASTTPNIAQGKVVAVTGKIIAVMPDGSQHVVQLGEVIATGVRLIIPADATIELQAGNGEILHIAEPRDLTITDDVFGVHTAGAGTTGTDATDAALAPLQPEAQQVLASLQNGLDPLSQLEAAAAGLGGGAGGEADSGITYVILGRVAESITPASFELGITSSGFTGTSLPVSTPHDNPPSITVTEPTNDGPDAHAQDGLVYEAGLNTQTSQGTHAGDGSAMATGTFTLSDPDGLGDIAKVTINGHDIPLGQLVGTVLGTPLGQFTITGFNTTTGVATYVYTLNSPSNADGPHGTTSENFTLTVTDSAGNTSGPAQIVVTIVDDAPQIHATNGETPIMLVDESALPGGNASPGDSTTDHANFSGAFSSQYGADGAGHIDYALSVTSGSDSGLIDTATNQHVLLSVNSSGVIEGRTAGSGDLVFTVQVDSSSGEVTLQEFRAVEHPNASDPNDSVSLSSGLVALNATITDADGSQASASMDLGTSLYFRDDGPVIEINREAFAALNVDETALPTGNPDLTPSYGTSDTESFSGLFTSHYGADGAGSLVYSLNVTAGPSGLVDTATHEDVILSVNGSGVVEGRTAGGDLVFTVAVDGSGNVTLDLLRAVTHSDTSNPNDVTSLANNLVTLTATITDADGDHSAATASIGSSLHFYDDGPTVSLNQDASASLNVDETALPTGNPDLTPSYGTSDTESFSGLFTSHYGADGAGSLVYSLNVTAGPSGLVDTATHEDVILSVNGSGVVEGRTAGGDLVFTVAVDGSGNVTLDLLRAVTHSDTSNPNDVTSLANNLVTLTATITDADGDHSAATASIGSSLHFYDDGPTVSLNQDASASLNVDETALPTGNPDLTPSYGTSDTESFSGLFTPHYGADGAGSLVYSLGVVAGPSGLVDTATGQNVILSVNGSGVVEGRATGGALVFTVAVDGSGNVTLDLLRAVTHSDTSNPNDVTSLANNLVTLTATITDKDGDHNSATASIGSSLHFYDDGPTVDLTHASVALNVDETALPTGNPDLTPSYGTSDTESFSGLFTSHYGADGAGSLVYSLNVTAGPSGLVDTATHEDVILSVNGSGVVEGRTAGGDLVFTVAVDGSGNVTLDLLRAVTHSDTSNPNDVTSLANNLVTLTATITDADGDHSAATASIGSSLHFYDDGPTV
ncbi:retention module-containing protein, partial [Vogesella sp. LIG4]|uniref:retention module-containing protein n=1 Tax=Vogesella sp. LIG4 TaxID=1192162 RepID=UPI00081F8D16